MVSEKSATFKEQEVALNNAVMQFKYIVSKK